MGMNPVENTDIYNNVTFQAAQQADNVFGTPQFDDITFAFPPYPMIYQPKPVPEVK